MQIGNIDAKGNIVMNQKDITGIGPNNREASDIRGIRDSATVIDLDSSMTAAEIQEIIDVQDRYIPFNKNLTFAFADGTYTLDTNLQFHGFDGPGYLKIGDFDGSTTLHTTQPVILNCSAGTYAIDVQNCYQNVDIFGLKIVLSGGASMCIRYNRTGGGRISYCYLKGLGGTSGYGIFNHGSNGLTVKNVYVDSVRYGIMTEAGGSTHSSNNGNTGVTGNWGLAAISCGMIGKTGTQMLGSTADEQISSGGTIS